MDNASSLRVHPLVRYKVITERRHRRLFPVKDYREGENMGFTGGEVFAMSPEGRQVETDQRGEAQGST